MGHPTHRFPELCESRGGRLGFPVPNSPYGLCGRKTAFEEEEDTAREKQTRTRDVHFLSVSKNDLFSQFVLQACWDLAFALCPKVQHSSGSS